VKKTQRQSDLEVRERAIELVASEPTNELGVTNVVMRGLLTKRQIVTFLADEKFAAKVLERREAILGEVVEQVKLIARRAAPTLMVKLVEIAAGKQRAKRYQVDAIKAVLERADVEHASAVVPGLFMALFARIQQGQASPGMIEVDGDEDRESAGG
jgi:hypothetical protein